MINLVTGYKGIEHITSDDDASRNASFIGIGKYVVKKGHKLSLDVITNNHVRIYDGECFNQGRHIRINTNDYEDITIDNGSQSTKRNDLIVLRFSKNSESGIENAEIVVLKGDEAIEVANDPEHIEGNLFNGDLIDDMLLYRVCLDGINIVKIDRLFEYMLTMDDIYKLFKQLFNKTALYDSNPKDEFDKLNNEESILLFIDE